MCEVVSEWWGCEVVREYMVGRWDDREVVGYGHDGICLISFVLCFQGFCAPSHDDKFMEVVGITGITHMVS